MRSANRWGIAAAGVLMQLALGAIYAWSVFRIPLAKQFGWTISQVTLTFTISIFIVGFAAFFGGLWLNRKGPRIVAIASGLLYGGGVFLASFSDRGLPWLYLTYGLLGGIGLGFGYIVPVAVLVKWFPDRRGMITGIAVAGFGAGALVTAPLTSWLIQNEGVLRTFAYLGIAYAVAVVAGGIFMQNPPRGWKPEGWTPAGSQISQRASRDYALAEALRTWQWWALWLVLFLNASAGVSLISQESPMFQELDKVSAAVAAQMVGIASIGNSLGRIFWASVSDAITRKLTFSIMLIIQVLLFWFFPGIHFAGLTTAAAFAVLMCYGGGFGIMPAFVADYFGARNVGPIYGLMLTAWGFASVFGPLLIARMREISGGYAGALHVIAAVMAVSALLPVVLRPPGSSQPEVSKEMVYSTSE